VLISKREKRYRRHKRVRAKIMGTASCPRISVFRSHRRIYAQLIDDEKGITLTAASNRSGGGGKEGMVERGFTVGEMIARVAKEKGIMRAVFDRGGYAYHGVVRTVAEGARKGGLKV
jgi:large subunit ribosomal protein L18